MASGLPYYNKPETHHGPFLFSLRRRTALLFLLFVLLFVLWFNSNIDNTQELEALKEEPELIYIPQQKEEPSLGKGSVQEIKPIISQTPQHFEYFILIASRVSNISRRQLIRQNYFGLQDNIEPCMKRDRGIQYMFWLYGDIPHEKTPERRAYETEYMEWADMIKIETDSFHQDKALRWARSYFEKNNISFGHLIIQDGYSFIQLNSLKETIDSQVSKDYIWFSPQYQNTLVAGSDAFEKLWDYEDEVADIIPDHSLIMNLYEFSRSVDFLQQVSETQKEKDSLTDHFKLPSFINDRRHTTWDNSIEAISDQIVSVSDIYQASDFVLLAQTLSLKPWPLCQSFYKPHLALVTSSFIYPDSCMEKAAPSAADNKRQYAQIHDYAFIARSTEFAQQDLRQDRRRTVWGKIDAVQKVLPKYDWIFWMDMDAVIMNPNITVHRVLDTLRAQYPNGPRAFEESIDLVIAKPTRDKMINAGVFFMRNTAWSMEFLKEVQAYRKWYNLAPSFEQGAMWELLQLPKYAKHVLMLENDDHTFNTLPNRYISGDFIVHFAPDKCPGPAVLKGLEAAKKIQYGETITRFEE
ncbi:galactosyl transferase GMA12/MNN10 family-domain-containing protein [Sporodiniella umbellata]|nr:galactosyl transferase GMA12/MNN10 family-domain-containing protein [Sporodiniella umbellata]